MDDTTFKVEHEGDNITDRSLEEWTAWMDAQLEERFGDQRPRLLASSLNFSRNSLGNDGMRSLVEYLRGRDIGVQTLKLFRNSIGDGGAWAIGKLLAHAPVPVHEIHLSHNALTEKGACSVLESIARSGRYPYLAEHAGRKDQRGHAPVWLRMEHNCINWGAIEHRLEQRQLRWCTADSRDGWHPKERAPMVCMHNSFRNQNAEQTPGACVWGSSGGCGEGVADEEEGWTQEVVREEPLNGQLILAALQGDGAARKSLDAQLGQSVVALGAPPSPQVQPAPAAIAPVAANAVCEEAYGQPGGQGPGEEAAEENVPLYVFLDAGAVMQMLSQEGLVSQGLFTFQSLLNLCQQGHMKCRPPRPELRPAKPWVGPVEERECVMLVVTDAVLEELSELAERDSNARRRCELLRGGQEPYLQLCLEWGIVEVLETVLHTQLMRLTPDHERLAREMGVSRPALKMLDFVSLWESQIMMEGRVLLVSPDEGFCRFSCEARGLGRAELCPTVVHYDALNRWFAEDSVHGGQQLCEAAGHRQARHYCGAVLSAALLATVVGLAGAEAPPPPAEGEGAEAPGALAARAATAPPAADTEAGALQVELREALALVTAARQLLCPEAGSDVSGEAQADGEAARCVERMDAAMQRWRALLDKQS